METKANYVAIGLFTLLLTAVGFGFIYWIARYDETRPTTEVIVRFEGSVAGLIRGGAVMFNGIKVGEVAKLEYDPDNPKYVKADLLVDAGIPLKEDSDVSLSFQGLTGVGTVEIKGGSPDLPDLLDQPGTPEMIAQSSSFEDLMNGARQLMSRADKVLSKIETVVDTNQDGINKTVQNIESFTTALNNNSGNIETFLADASDAAKGLTSLSGKLEGLSERADTLLAAVDPESIKTSIANVETISENLVGTSNRFDSIVADASEAAKGINDFSSNLNTSLGKVDRLVESVDPETISSAVASLQNFATTLDESSGDINVILTNAKQASGDISSFSSSLTARTDDFNAIVTDAQQLAARLNKASERIDGILGKVDGILSDEDGGKGVIEEVTLAARSIRSVADKFNSRADEISDGLARFSGSGLRNVEAMVSEARRTIKRVEGAVNKLEKDPSSVIFGGNKVKTFDQRY
ncbi:phospholipid/cholesterol/gamma-HCH transport system substrate-binding protein [Cohaesibacter marisflavi]|uniref:Phospholipid/cholesterol/gamma-HCH transport system substrate-binding protein n=1 Tax=Cohaesibacter marisflavi TaxID=655353 RepID=A0A1I5IZR4_9HYPH|nr:MlaD family protein [Cohaesibacter marisflavi]SFO65899.1 phospholipid/cholesterol/gamma-HCH transport system substrate-binding protein [Cohaesibacter marisflavi]